MAINKRARLVVLSLVLLSILLPSIVYAIVYETKLQNLTQTIKRAWYDPLWNYRKSITIQESQVPDPKSLDATGGYVNIGSPNWGSVMGTLSFWIK